MCHISGVIVSVYASSAVDCWLILVRSNQRLKLVFSVKQKSLTRVFSFYNNVVIQYTNIYFGHLYILHF
jgi:hypothetical protein